MTARHANPDDFARLADGFGRRELIELLGVDRKTLRRWLAGKGRIPWAAYQLAFERSRYGLAERDSAEHFNRTMMRGELEALRAKVARLEAELVKQAELVNWSAANDPYTLRTDPRSSAQDRGEPAADGAVRVDLDRHHAVFEIGFGVAGQLVTRARAPREPDSESDADSG